MDVLRIILGIFEGTGDLVGKRLGFYLESAIEIVLSPSLMVGYV
jgi:hypothetical protein